VNHHPIIGILSIPYKNSENSFIEQSYVRMVESSGARAVPIIWNSSKRNIDFLLNSVNGVLIAGDYPLSRLRRKSFKLKAKRFYSVDETVNYVLQKAFELNGSKIHFPVWTQSYGFEFIMLHLSKDMNIFDDINSERYTTSIIPNDMENNEMTKLIKSNETTMNTFISNINTKGPFNLNNVMKHKMFTLFDDKDLHMFYEGKSFFFNAIMGVPAKSFFLNENLVETIIPTSFALDRNGNLTVSSFEFKDLPIYGTQFQTDKSSYTVTDEDYINHSLSDIQINRKFSDFFVEESKKNYQKFADKPTENKYLFEENNSSYKQKKYVYMFSKEEDD